MHLTIKEKLNAQKLYNELDEKIKQARENIRTWQYKKRQLHNFLSYSLKSKTKGFAILNSYSYKKFHKDFSELTPEELREYNRNMKKISRKNIKNKNKILGEHKNDN